MWRSDRDLSLRHNYIYLSASCIAKSSDILLRKVLFAYGELKANKIQL